MENDFQEIIRGIVTELIEKIGFSAAVKVTVSRDSQSQDVFFCSVSVEEGQNFLIGQYGMNLAALQHLVRILVRRRIGEKLDIIVDVNDYFSEKKLLLEKEAEQALGEVLQNNTAVTLRPMLPYERKMVHAFLSTRDAVMTESVGMGENRKVIVRPKPLAGE